MFAQKILFVAISLGASSYAVEKETSAADVCLKMLTKEAGYSVVLKANEPFVLLTQPLRIVSQVSLASVMSRFPQGSAIVKSLPELARLKWTKTASWNFYSQPNGIFARIVRYHISRDGFLAIELKLELEELNEEVIRALVGSLERKDVSALVSGDRTSLAVYRLDLSDPPTREAVKEFLKFLKRNELNGDYVRAISRSSPI